MSRPLILRYISANYKLPPTTTPNTLKMLVNKALADGVKRGEFKQPKGTCIELTCNLACY